MTKIKPYKQNKQQRKIIGNLKGHHKQQSFLEKIFMFHYAGEQTLFKESIKIAKCLAKD